MIEKTRNIAISIFIVAGSAFSVLNAQNFIGSLNDSITKYKAGDVKFPYAGMGLGLGVQVIKNRASLSVLGSDGEYVGGGAYRTEFWVDPKEDLTGIILVQLREPQYNLRFHDTIKTLIYQALR
jgi:CubicO group peptidase (beta-lactamase class C family)